MRDNKNRFGFNTSAGKLPPQAIDLEEAVLGAVMIQPECLDEIENILKPEVFYKECNSLIYTSKIGRAHV